MSVDARLDSLLNKLDRFRNDAGFKKGDKIRLNRSGAEVETVLLVRGNMLVTDRGNEYHVTKVVRADSMR